MIEIIPEKPDITDELARSGANVVADYADGKDCSSCTFCDICADYFNVCPSLWAEIRK